MHIVNIALFRCCHHAGTAGAARKHCKTRQGSVNRRRFPPQKCKEQGHWDG